MKGSSHRNTTQGLLFHDHVIILDFIDTTVYVPSKTSTGGATNLESQRQLRSQTLLTQPSQGCWSDEEHVQYTTCALHGT